MRLARLDLLAYGHFSGETLDLPGAFHLVHGPNEAGKSTALAAIEDFLFGIPARSALNFLHDYGELRIGARLEADGAALEAVRRKGNRDTLLAPDGTPLSSGESALAPFLGGADRAFLARMFSLDHLRLRAGGAEMLDPANDAGRAILSAGAGIAGLGQRLDALEAEADAIWAPRRAGHRSFYQAKDRLDAAEAALREATVTAEDWEARRDAAAAAGTARAEAEAACEAADAELRRLGRIRRVARDVARLAEAEAELEGLQDAPLLPEDARTTLEESERRDGQLAARIETLEGQRTGAEAARDAIAPNPALLARAGDIRALAERRIEVRKARADLPGRLADLAAAESAMARLGAELGWEGDAGALAARLPEQAAVARLRSLIARHGGLEAGLAAAGKAAQEAEAAEGRLAREIGAAGEAPDTGRLAALLAALPDPAELAARLREAERGAERAAAAIRQHLAGLHPGAGDAAALAAVPVPPEASVQAARDRERAAAQRLAEARETLRRAERDLAGLRAEHERTAAGETVSEEELAALRAGRDAGWRDIRRAAEAGESVPRPRLDEHEAAVARADAAADRRFETAEAAAALAALTRRVAAQEDAVTAARGDLAAAEAEAADAEAGWQGLWAGSGVDPAAPEAMLLWLGTRETILGHAREQAGHGREADAARGEIEAARDGLAAALAALGHDAGDASLAAVAKLAARVCHDGERVRDDLARLRREARSAAEERAAKAGAVEEAAAALAAWQADWGAALVAAGLAPDTGPESAGTLLDTVEELRGLAKEAADLRLKRIGRIARDAEAFAEEAGALAAELAPDLGGGDADAAALALAARLAEAERLRDARAAEDDRLATLSEEIAGLEAEREAARAAIAALHEAAGAADAAALAAAIGRSEARRSAEQARGEALARLEAEGDGHAPAELAAECAGVDLDGAAARMGSLDEGMAALRERLLAAREAEKAARAALEAVGGGDAAVRAGAEREAALAELERAAEDYARLRGAAVMLRWAVERYRREKQAPLLARAGAIFAELTLGSFEGLALDFEGDTPVLAGRRPGGALVRVAGMSTGSADQLYLALRIAAVEDYLDRAAPLPFVADDLFVNFDDARAGAGFRVLAALSRRCQVLFFTHHAHLAEVARAAAGDDIAVTTLNGAAIRGQS